MKAVLLTAGDGGRLAPITQTLPKALLPVGPETILARQIRQLVTAGVTEIVVVIGYEGEAIREHVAASNWPITIHFVENRQFMSTSTAFSAALAEKFVAGADFFLLDGGVFAEDALIQRIG